jgi:hypothetical protein
VVFAELALAAAGRAYEREGIDLDVSTLADWAGTGNGMQVRPHMRVRSQFPVDSTFDVERSAHQSGWIAIGLRETDDPVIPTAWRHQLVYGRLPGRRPDHFDWSGPTSARDLFRAKHWLCELRALPDRTASIDTLIDDRGFGWVLIIFPGDQSIAECILRGRRV